VKLLQACFDNFALINGLPLDKFIKIRNIGNVISLHLKNMKIINYLFLAATAVFCLNCSSGVNSAVSNTSAASTGAANSQASASATPAAAPQIAPDALVKDLYEQHDKKNSPFFQTKNRAPLDKYFDKKLADLIWKDANDSKGEVGVIDGDPLYNAQDTEIKNFSIASPKIEREKAEVVVTFNNFDKKEKLTYKLVQRNSEWKIEDIDYGDGSSLLGWFKDASKETSSADANFEGTYQVGDAICTVKPVKMAFEVKWAKGAGVEMFFSEGEANDKFIFASRPTNGEKSNAFSFDDENYKTGTFYRSDGKEMPIKKIK
jgi:hypothetical protein